ncbi:MAG: universal stress protein [Longimicrobiales bacterium]
MYQRIVVPLDGTALAERALPWAGAIAARSNGDLRLVHVHIPFRLPTTQGVLGPRVGDTLRRMGEEQEDRVEAYLKAAGERVSGEASAPEFTAAVLKGPTAASLERDARTKEATLIVMAPRDRNSLARLMESSVTTQLVRSCPVPVLAVRGTNGAVPDETPDCRCILVPLDGTPRCEGAVDHAMAMAELFDATVVLLRVERPGQWAAHAAATYLEEVADGIHRAGVRVETRVLADRDVAAAINALAIEIGAGMIVIGSRYRNGLPRLIRGGLAETFVRAAPIPVLVVGRKEGC